MKTVKARGGLGNQLFCIAFAHSVATLTRSEVALDIGGYRRDRYGHAFLLKDLAASFGLGISARPILAGRVLGAAMRLLPLAGYVCEGAAPRDSEALKRLVARGFYFNGYWQNERWMAAPETMRSLVRAFLDRWGGTARRHDVLIHYRTYKDELNPRRRGDAGPDFVRRALETIELRGGPVSDVVLISDDPALAMRRLGEVGNRASPLVSGAARTDMALMLHARALILSNSSFSWWGGFCGDAETIIYPERGAHYHYPEPAGRFTCL